MSSLELKLHNTAGLPKPTRSGLLLVQAWDGGGSIVLKPTEFSKSDTFTATERNIIAAIFPVALLYHRYHVFP